MIARALAIVLIGAGLFAFAVADEAIIIIYQADEGHFPNPERGFYYQTAPLWLGTERIPQDAADLRSSREQGVSLLRWYFVIDEYREHPLDEAVLEYINAQFAAARDAGLKVIPRFAYNFPIAGEYPYQEADADLKQVLAHIDQLAPLLRANGDVIAFMEAGFIGAWGEWHSSTHGLVDEVAGLNEASRAILERLLAALPPERMLALRYPSHKRQLFALPLTTERAFSATTQARLAAHNDCFLASATDWGTYSEIASIRDRARAYLRLDNRFVVQSGETCHAKADAQPYIQCPYALAELAYLRYSALNLDYHPDVLALWSAQGCMPQIERRLGYRLRLVSVAMPPQARAGELWPVRVTLVNEGFASPYNPRSIELILRRDGVLYRFALNEQQDPRFWLPDAGHISFTLAVALPWDLASGPYEVLLALPDPHPALYSRPEYAVRLANVGVWEADSGLNRLNATLYVLPE